MTFNYIHIFKTIKINIIFQTYSFILFLDSDFKNYVRGFRK